MSLKKYLLPVLFVTIATFVKAQTPFYTENFNTNPNGQFSLYPNWNFLWFGTNNQQSWLWASGANVSMFNYAGAVNGCMFMEDVDDEFENGAEAVSPAINCSGKNSVYLSLVHLITGGVVDFNIQVSTDSANWTNFYLSTQSPTNPVYVDFLNISSVAANQPVVYIRLVTWWQLSFGNPGNRVYVDDLRLFSSNCAQTATITPTGPTNFCAGGSVTFNANTGPGLTYQWRKNSVNIPGATLNSYTAATTGSYNVVVTNNSGCSKGATPVAVTAQPSIAITAGGPTHFCTGGNVTLSATSGQTVTCQWRKNSVNIAGATASSYTATTTGNYNCVVTNSFGCSKGGTPVVITGPPSAVITPGGPTTFCAGGNVVLSAQSGYTYQWVRNSVNISGATLQNYTATTPGNYKVKVTDAFACSKTTPGNKYACKPQVTFNCVAKKFLLEKFFLHPVY